MRIALVALALLTVAASASAPDATAEREVATVNLDRLHALAEGDMARLERLFADDFVYITPTGKVETKDDFRKEVAGGYKLEFVEPDNLRIRVHGSAAVVTYTTRRINPSSLQVMESISTCVYVRGAHSAWQLVSQQTNRIAPSKPSPN